MPYRLFACRDLEGTSLANDQVWIASSDMEGWRRGMEDKQRIILNWIGSEQRFDAYVALFDGHGGPYAARYALAKLPSILESRKEFHKQDYCAALKKAFMAVDKEICNDGRIVSGCTALVALLVNRMIYMASVGDSRAVICTSGYARDLTEPHTTSQPKELERIIKAGGYVDDGRVCGRLAMTRSLGDAHFKENKDLRPKEQIVTADPDVNVHEVQSEDEFLVLASDGIWDCFSSQEIVDIIRHQVSLGATLAQVCAFICETCLAPTQIEGRGTDNMTIIVIAFLNGRTQREWIDWIAMRVKMGVGRATPSTIPQIFGSRKPLSHPPHIDTDFGFILPPITDLFPYFVV